jgi:hypothetical protein
VSIRLCVSVGVCSCRGRCGLTRSRLRTVRFGVRVRDPGQRLTKGTVWEAPWRPEATSAMRLQSEHAWSSIQSRRHRVAHPVGYREQWHRETRAMGLT